MTQAAKPTESAHPSNGRDPGDRSEWWLVSLTSGICVAATVAAVVLTLLF